MKIERDVTIKALIEFFGPHFDLTGWGIQRIDQKDIVIDDSLLTNRATTLNPARGRGRTDGYDVESDLGSRSDVILLGAGEFLYFFGHKDLIPGDWKGSGSSSEEDQEFEYVRFYNDRLISPKGHYFVLAIFYHPDAEQFEWDVQSLGDEVDGSEKAAVIFKHHLE